MGSTDVVMSYRQCFTLPKEFQIHKHYLCPKDADSSTSWLGNEEAWFLLGMYPSWGSAWFLVLG